MKPDIRERWFFTRFRGWLGSSREEREGSPQLSGAGGSLRSTPATPILILAVTMGLLALSEARGEHRTALLIGNAEYANEAPHASSGKDIKLVDAVLKKHGFRTVLATDLTKEEMYAAVRRFVKTTPINGSGFVYFRGEVVKGKSFDQRDTPVLLGTEGNGKGLPLIALMEWMYLHCATARNMIVLDDCGERPSQAGTRGPYGISATDVPANTWLGFADVAHDTDVSVNRSTSDFAKKFSSSKQSHLGKRLTDACGWTKTTCRKPLFSEPVSRAVAAPISSLELPIPVTNGWLRMVVSSATARPVLKPLASGSESTRFRNASGPSRVFMEGSGRTGTTPRFDNLQRTCSLGLPL